MEYYDDNGLPYDEDNDSELYSADCFYERWPDRKREDDEHQTFEEWLIEEYKKDPVAFAERRDAVYCFGYVDQKASDVKDKWLLVDCDRNEVYAAYNKQQLAEFIGSDRVIRAYRRILMDRVVELAPSKGQSYLLDHKYYTNICLIKGCIKAFPLAGGWTFFSEDADAANIRWHTENTSKREEQELCCELYGAGMHNEMIDAYGEDAKLPF